MKVEFNTESKEKVYKSIIKKEKEDFKKIMKKLEVNNEKKFNVYAIAAKIARGEFVTTEELQYIKQHAPSLYESAKDQNRRRLEDEKEKSNISKEGKQTNSSNQVSDNSENTNQTSEKTGTGLIKGDSSNSINIVSSGVKIW